MENLMRKTTINSLLQGHKCSCGKTHSCNIEAVFVEKNAIARLQPICKNFSSILLVADENTFAVAGEKTVQALQGKALDRVIFSGKEVLVPNEAAVDAVKAKLSGADLMIGIGSGVIQDLCKYVSFCADIPYMVVATAPSMDGYASDGAAMILGGMKVTKKAGLPRAIVADTEILANAPMDMIRAGYGDIIGKYSALNDWKLSHCINGEYFCQEIYDLTYAQIGRTLELAQGLTERKEESVRALMEALVIIGILMSFAGSSRPASGSEHHLSHFFEITGIVDGTAYLSHGLDVAYSTVVTAGLREKLLEKPFPQKIFRLKEEDYKRTVERIYKQVAPGCMALQAQVGDYAKDRLPIYLEKEAQIRQILGEMPAAEQILSMLKIAGLDINEFYQLYSEEKISQAVLYAKDLKDRYTVLWPYYDLYGYEI